MAEGRTGTSPAARFLCTGDLHIGAGADYSDDRLADQQQILARIADVAREHHVDAILGAGDVFHRPKPTPPQLHTFARFARDLEHAGIPSIWITGNAGHDIVNGDEPCALELFASDWLRVSRTPEVLKAAGDVAVCTLPSVPVHRLVASHGRGGVNELAVAALLETAHDLWASAPDGWPTVLLGHWAVDGASLPNGLPTNDLHEPVLPVDALERIGFNSIVMGHIHRPQRLGQRDTGFYVGSPGTWDFGEAGFDHGVWILDVSDSGCTETFVPVDDRPFVTVDVDLADDGTIESFDHDDETDVIAAAISLPVTDAVVRIRYRCTEEQARRVDVNALKGYLAEAGAHRLYQLTPDIVRASRARVEGVDEDLDPLAAVDAYVTAADLQEPSAAALRAYAGELLEEVTA